MDYREAMRYMEEAKRYGDIVEEKRLWELCRRLGNPQKGQKIVYIAGKNGKSSVIAYIAAIMKCAGYKAGCYMSPVIGEHREKMQVNGRKITKQEFADCMEAVREAAGEMEAEGERHPVPAEMEIAAALLYFRRKECHILLMESRTRGEERGIYMEKGGKTEDGILFMARRGECKGNGANEEQIADITDGQMAYPVRKMKYGIEKQRFSYREYDNLEICMGGRFQPENAVLAIEAVRGLEKFGFKAGEKQLRKGLMMAVKKGCFTVLGKKPYFIADGAHNEEAAEKLAESVRFSFPGKRIIYIFGCLRDEEYREMLQKAAGLAEHIITVTVPEHKKAMHAYELAQTAAEFHPMVTAADSLEEAAELGFLLAGRNGVVVATGSPLYLSRIMKIAAAKMKKEN